MFKALILAVLVTALPALWAGGCDSSPGTVPGGTNDTFSCGLKGDGPDVCTVTTTDTFEAADSATNDVSEDTTPTGDTVPQSEDTTACQFQAGDYCPGMEDCILRPRTDGRWDCGSVALDPDFVCRACF